MRRAMSLSQSTLFCAMPHFLTKRNRISQILTCKMFNAFHMHFVGRLRWNINDKGQEKKRILTSKRAKRTTHEWGCSVMAQINYRKIWSSKKSGTCLLWRCVKLKSIELRCTQTTTTTFTFMYFDTHTHNTIRNRLFAFTIIVWNSVSENIRAKFMLNVIKWFADDHLIDLITE